VLTFLRDEIPYAHYEEEVMAIRVSNLGAKKYIEWYAEGDGLVHGFFDGMQVVGIGCCGGELTRLV
jgi:hypothetical protein